MGVLLITLLVGMGAIILLTARYGIHPFFALLCACVIVGIGIGLPLDGILTTSKEGFGNILKALGFILVFGSTLGVILEHTGSTQALAAFLMRKVGAKRAPLAMSLTGYVVGLPIFCDSGFIVLSGLTNTLSRRTGTAAVVMAVCMATGLYSVHCLIPPHPGATAAAATLGVDYGSLILIGSAVALPAMLAGYGWARYAGKKSNGFVLDETTETQNSLPDLPAVERAFLPILVPVLLIAVKSFVTLAPDDATSFQKLLFLGDPVPALCIGILLALRCKKSWTRTEVNQLLAQAVEKAGGILIIIGAGGAFGAILAAAHPGTYLGGMGGLKSFGLAIPFAIAFILKTAQGSSTVAIITAVSIVQPLLPALGLASAMEKVLAVLSMGAGSMMISHANDAYFWVIAKFSGLPVKQVLRVYTVATIFMALTSLLVIYLIYFLL